MTIDVLNRVRVYELNGVEPTGEEYFKAPKLEVLSHWNVRGFVVLHYGDLSVTVNANDMRAAISNAENKGSR